MKQHGCAPLAAACVSGAVPLQLHTPGRGVAVWRPDTCVCRPAVHRSRRLLFVSAGLIYRKGSKHPFHLLLWKSWMELGVSVTMIAVRLSGARRLRVVLPPHATLLPWALNPAIVLEQGVQRRCFRHAV